MPEPDDEYKEYDDEDWPKSTPEEGVLLDIERSCNEQLRELERISLKLDDFIEKYERTEKRKENSLGCFLVIFIIAILLIVAWAIKQV